MGNINLIKNELFKFDISISDKCYDHKPTSNEYAHMTFHVERLSVEELCQKIIAGHSFCHVFKNNIRKKVNFLSTNLVVIDVDDFTISMLEFVENCNLKPSLAYSTFSDGRNGLHRFRLIYVFDEPIYYEEMYKRLYSIVTAQIGLQYTKDNCGSVISQLMNGNSKEDIKTFCSNEIFFKEVFLQKCQLELYQSSPSQYISNRQFCKNMEEDAKDEESQIISDLYVGTNEFLEKYYRV